MSYDENEFELDDSIENLLDTPEYEDNDNRPVAKANFATIKKGQKLNIISEGSDWYGISNNGKLIHAPRWVVE